MEVPEIVWLSPNEYRSNEPSCFWSESQRTDYDIEYVCKDAFIKKACEWLSQTDFCHYYNKEFIDEFRKAMEE